MRAGDGSRSMDAAAGGGRAPFPLEGEELQEIALHGTTLVADRSGALYWHAERTLLVADLHLEKGSAHAQRGVMLPPYDTRETLGRLAGAIARYEPARVIALGDSFHDVGAARRIGVDDLDHLCSLQRGREWIWITGNHDPQIGTRVGGHRLKQLVVGGLTLRHEPAPGAARGEIAGHLHPSARLAADGASIRRRCFVGNGRRLVMPAFGAFAGGLNVLDEVFRALFGDDDMAVWMLGDNGLYAIAPHRLSAG